MTNCSHRDKYLPSHARNCTEAPTWHPDHAGASHGTVLGPWSTEFEGAHGFPILRLGCTFEDAQRLYPAVVRSADEIPVVVDKR